MEQSVDNAAFKKWYAANKDKLADKRKKKYEKDPSYRKKLLLDSKRNYWLKRRRATSLSAAKVDFDELALKPDKVVPVLIKNEQDIRYGQTVEVPMYYTGSLAQVVQRTTQTIRLWYNSGFLPEALYRNATGYRMLTEDQMRVYADNQYLLSLTVKEFDKHPFFKELHIGMEKLSPEGLKPMLKGEWREDPERCRFCGAHTSLQHLEDNVWQPVPCFSCKPKHDTQERLKARTVQIVGQCSLCEFEVDEERRVVGSDFIVVCARCGARLTKFDVKEQEDEG